MSVRGLQRLGVRGKLIVLVGLLLGGICALALWFFPARARAIQMEMIASETHTLARMIATDEDAGNTIDIGEAIGQVAVDPVAQFQPRREVRDIHLAGEQ